MALFSFQKQESRVNTDMRKFEAGTYLQFKDHSKSMESKAWLAGYIFYKGQSWKMWDIENIKGILMQMAMDCKFG